MKRLFFAMLAAAALLLPPAFASPAMAATTTAVSMTFDENVAPGNAAGCAVLANGTGLCGHGQVIPYGQATETVVFGSGCGGSCDLRAITLKGGSITLEETLGDMICPGACPPNPGNPLLGALTDVVAGGTGEFSGASGTVNGSVTHAGANAVIRLSGTITLP